MSNCEKITIITPCSRPRNIFKIYNTLNFGYIYQWIIVYDTKKVNIVKPLFRNINNKISEYFHSDVNSRWGNSQRNYGLDKIKNKNSYIYFLDDDNIIHPDFYVFLDKISLNDEKIFTWNQDNNGRISKGDRLYVGGLDTAIFLIHYKYCKGNQWNSNINSTDAADALFFLDCYKNNEDKHNYINKTLCYYNKVR